MSETIDRLVLCKVMEHLISYYVHRVLNAKYWLYNCQHCFREGFSCDSQISSLVQDHSQITRTSLVQDLAKEIDKDGRLDAVMIDFSKAFDLMPHGI